MFNHLAIRQAPRLHVSIAHNGVSLRSLSYEGGRASNNESKAGGLREDKSKGATQASYNFRSAALPVGPTSATTIICSQHNNNALQKKELSYGAKTVCSGLATIDRWS